MVTGDERQQRTMSSPERQSREDTAAIMGARNEVATGAAVRGARMRLWAMRTRHGADLQATRRWHLAMSQQCLCRWVDACRPTKPLTKAGRRDFPLLPHSRPHDYPPSLRTLAAALLPIPRPSDDVVLRIPTLQHRARNTRRRRLHTKIPRCPPPTAAAAPAL